MEALKQNPSRPISAPPPLNLEPDHEWKRRLKISIEAGLRSIVDEDRQELESEFAKGIIGPEERDRLTADFVTALETVRQLAEEQFQVALEQERQERRWACGEQVDPAWSESMMKAQQAIANGMGRDGKAKASAMSSQPSPSPSLLPQPYPPPLPLSSNHKVERVTQTSTHPPDPRQNELGSSSRLARNARAGPRPSMNARPDMYEFWRPSTMPEDPPIPRLFAFARQNAARPTSSFSLPSILSVAFTDPLEALSTEVELGRSNSHSSDQVRDSSYRAREGGHERPDVVITRSSVVAPSILSDTFTDPLDALSTNTDQEHLSVHVADQEWNSSGETPEKDRERERDMHADDLSAHSGGRSIQIQERSGLSQPPTPSSSSATHSLPWDSPRIRVPEAHWEGSSHSSQTSEVDWSWQSSHNTGHYFLQEREDFEDGSHNGFDNRNQMQDYIDLRIQALQGELLRHDKAVNQREGELARKVGELVRWGGARVAEQRREDDQRSEEEVEQHGGEAERKAKPLGNRQETDRKGSEVAMGDEEGRREEEEPDSRETMNGREEVRRMEVIKMMEEEARRKEFEATRKQEEAEKKEEEARRKMEEVILRVEETRKKEEEFRKRESELDRREADLSRREGEIRRREDKLQERFLGRERIRQRIEERKKQEDWKARPPEMSRPTPSPRQPDSSGPRLISNHKERGTPATGNRPIDRISTSAYNRSSPTNGGTPTSAQTTSVTSTQPSSAPKSTEPTTLRPKPATSSIPNPPLTEAKLHRRKVEQVQQTGDQSLMKRLAGKILG